MNAATTEPGAAGSQAAGSQAVNRAAALLALVVESDRPRTFTSLVEELGLAKSTTSRLLHALERGRLVQRDRAGTFRPGALLAVYAAQHDAVHDLVALIQPALESLASATGETVNFAVSRGDAVVQVTQVDGRYLLGAANWVGVEVPAHCSALGKVFFAEGRLAVPAEPYQRRTDATITRRADLERELAEVLRRGYAVAWEELEVGLVALAAAVRAPDGGTVGAISISAPTARLPRNALARTGERLLAGAREASALLGVDSTAGRRRGGRSAAGSTATPAGSTATGTTSTAAGTGRTTSTAKAGAA
jgi:IclR family acetate operon transcriptional repressor